MPVRYITPGYSPVSHSDLQDNDLESCDEDKVQVSDSEDTVAFHARRDKILEGFLVALCILGHALLVASFLALDLYARSRMGFLLSFNGASLGEYAGYVYQRVVASPDLVIKVYLVPLLYITQKLALRRNVRMQHTLTAMDDKATAWLGLGAAVPVLWRYRDLFRRKDVTWRMDLRALADVACILLYFLASGLLGLVVPYLFQFGNTYGQLKSQKLVEALPRVANDAAHSTSDLMPTRARIMDAYPVLNILPVLWWQDNLVMTTSGLAGAWIYDIPEWSTDLNLSQLATFGYDVGCKAVTEAHQDGDFDVKNVGYPFFIHDALDDIVITPTARTLNVRSPYYRETRDDNPPATIFVASTVKVLDKNGTQSTSIAALEPPLLSCSEDGKSPCNAATAMDMIKEVQILACDVTPNPGNISVDTRYVPVRVEGWSGWDSTFWEDWTFPAVPTYPELFSIWKFPNLSPLGNSVVYLTPQTSPPSTSYPVRASLLENTLMEILDYQNAAYINLTDLEAAIGNALATVYWRGKLLLDINGPLNVSLSQDVEDTVLTWFALAASSVMLVMATILVRQPKPYNRAHRHYRLYALGVLEMTWLLGRDHRRTAEQLAVEEEPVLGNLRKRGKNLINPYCNC
ncbi:hypothetical protein PHLGIDRAFT_505159 [Phlebiopsis gigantea 11061_1 CR5-6]|uniref:Uncharacterized protein n=1 Tax=Phlebiopsis gigantea (strain 11061_1 CR5-6) TaxID=745531 RepID=A0A0C3PAB4_PHLG1|nr:hypothetical protein PHLGIDRAFT_505159 [Phlebiopsis gigantea 11061_1 CR5-6]